MSTTPWASILGRIPSGICILTARRGGDETGMLVSWVMQAGFEPPTISVAVRHGRYVADWLTAGGVFALNVLAAEQKNLLGHFGRGFEPGQPAFQGLSIERTAAGTPVLTDAVGHLECEPTGHVDSGDHRVFLARVIDGRLASDSPPFVHIRKSGLHY